MFKGKKFKSRIVLLICIMMMAMLALGGCGSSGSIPLDQTEDVQSGTSTDGLAPENLINGDMSLTDQNKVESGALPVTTPLKYGDNVKLIYTAYLNMQTTDYETTELELIALVAASEGYFEASYVDRGNYYAEENYLFGNYTVRVPADKYETFLSTVGQNCHVVSLNKTTTDVGVDYYDTEARLNTLKAKQERLMALLNKATTMSDIIELENSLSNTQYEIDSYSSTLNRYDSLIGYSTVQVSLEEVARLGSGVNEDEGFFASLGRSFVNGFNHFIDSIESLIMWIAYNIVAIIIALIAFIAGRRWYLKRAKEKGPLLQGFRTRRAEHKAEKLAKKAEKKDMES